MKENYISDVFKIINHDNRISLIAGRYLVRKKISVTPASSNEIAMIFRRACLDFLRHGDGEAAQIHRQRAEALECALGVLGVKNRLTGNYVLDKMSRADFEKLDRHFLSLMSSVDGVACSIRAVTALAQMAMDLRRTAMLYERYSGNRGFFFMLGRRFREAKQEIPSAGEAVQGYNLMVEAMTAIDRDATLDLPIWYANTSGSQIRKSMTDGGKVLIA